MACTENALASAPMDSEREEGEIVDDDLDELSDISSEEEYLLRQRLQVLENYNNVLERKEAKRLSGGPGDNTHVIIEAPLPDLSDISETELEKTLLIKAKHKSNKKDTKKPKILKSVKKRNIQRVQGNAQDHSKPKKPKLVKTEKNKEKNDKHHKEKKRVNVKSKREVTVLSESSDETEDEYRNKRRRLQDCVKISANSSKKISTDKTTLKTRLMNMFSEKLSIINEGPIVPNDDDELASVDCVDNAQTEITKICSESNTEPDDKNKSLENSEMHVAINKPIELIDLCSEDDIAKNSPDAKSLNTESRLNTEVIPSKDKSDHEVEASDDDLELLRQHALQTKSTKPPSEVVVNPSVPSEEEDSDTAELRLICLKSAMIKKAMEMKQKQKLRKRMSTLSSNLEKDLLSSIDVMVSYKDSQESQTSHDNTDIESVDMEIGVSDGPDVEDRDVSTVTENINVNKTNSDEQENSDIVGHIKNNKAKEDDFEEDEDLLRAKLLTSLSHNLPKLYQSDNGCGKNGNVKNEKEEVVKKNEPEPQRFIINIGESDSGSDHEATKNLTRMHLKLSEQLDFQQKLDLFLKSARTEVEKQTLEKKSISEKRQKTPEKFIPKAVNHLPNVNQLEYKQLVKRMAELEKMKLSRQSALNAAPRVPNVNTNIRDAMKENRPKNSLSKAAVINIERTVEQQISSSRKKIAEESAKVLKLKEEHNNLSQKYKIVMTELRNLRTAVALNKREQQAAQALLAKMRAQHQMLINRSSRVLHSAQVSHPPVVSNVYDKYKLNPRLKNNSVSLNDTMKNTTVLKSVKVSFVNDIPKKKTISETLLSVQVDVSNNKKVVMLPKDKVTNKDNSGDNDGKENFKPFANDTSLQEKSAVREEVPRVPNTDRTVTLEGKQITIQNSEFSQCHTNDEILGNSINKPECADPPLVSNHISLEPSINEIDDYRSPLQAMVTHVRWNEDPHGVLCPFEVGGTCKDAECKYLHSRGPVH